MTAAQYRQAVNKANNEIRRHNQAVKNDIRRYNQAVTTYNNAARQHNAQVRANRERLRRELARLNSTTTRTTTTTVTYRTSFVSVQEAYRRIEQAAEVDGWSGDDGFFDLIEGEAANSAARVERDAGSARRRGERRSAARRHTRITNELLGIDADFDARWHGALFSLNPANPDAARHFCTSSRELIDQVLLRAARDSAGGGPAPEL